MATSRRRNNPFSELRSDSNWGGRATRAEINLNAIAQNVSALVAHVAPVKLMAIVKANAYGHGAASVARIAIQSGASHLGVYTVSEAVDLRLAGIDAPVLVLGPFTRREAAAFWRYDITPTIHSLQSAAWLHEQAAERTLAFHVKVDTGLSRAGIGVEDTPELVLQICDRFSALIPEGIFTHFASADEDDLTFTHEQVQRFASTREILEKQGVRFALAHASNTAGLLSLPNANFDLVRTGIAVYGYYPSPTIDPRLPLHPALQLVSTVSRVHRIAAGTGVGYGHEFVARRPTDVALVPIGYGDGLQRSLGNGKGRALFTGGFAPIIGRISMDQITVDVTEIETVHTGDDVVLIGALGDRWHDAEHMASAAGTISYDVLTGLLPRVPRVYIWNGHVIGTSEPVISGSAPTIEDRHPAPQPI